MARRMPSLTALLALIAVAGYQNRDKISDFVKNMSASGGPLDEVKKKIGDSAQNTTVGGSLTEMLDQFKHNGEEDRAKSWIGTGPNQPANEVTLHKALGPEILNQISKVTGLSQDELLKRLSQVLPESVDQMTPNGTIPSA
jgi:uncharacterized protein YidB (DUF937 family)